MDKSEKSIWAVLLLFTGAGGGVFILSMMPKSFIADCIGKKEEAVQYEFIGTSPIAIHEDTVPTYNEATGECNGNHTIFTYETGYGFLSPDGTKLWVVADYFFDKNKAAAKSRLAELKEGDAVQLSKYSMQPSHIGCYNTKECRLRAVEDVRDSWGWGRNTGYWGEW